IHIQNLCAGYPQDGNDTCQCDAEGPLVCKDNSADFFWQVGLTSWGIGCARAKLPRVYIFTQSSCRWILIQMGQSPAAATMPGPAYISPPWQTPSP
ncbi:ACRO protein, partial [Neopipo cinnamomea]|nr:ACRO protein [Neopipo cinnamomea]